MPSNKKYTVKAKSLTGLGRTVFSEGDMVTVSNFSEGVAAELESKGFLVSEDANKPEFRETSEEFKSAPKIKAKKKYESS